MSPLSPILFDAHPASVLESLPAGLYFPWPDHLLNQKVLHISPEGQFIYVVPGLIAFWFLIPWAKSRVEPTNCCCHRKKLFYIPGAKDLDV